MDDRLDLDVVGSETSKCKSVMWTESAQPSVVLSLYLRVGQTLAATSPDVYDWKINRYDTGGHSSSSAAAAAACLACQPVCRISRSSGTPRPRCPSAFICTVLYSRIGDTQPAGRQAPQPAGRLDALRLAVTLRTWTSDIRVYTLRPRGALSSLGHTDDASSIPGPSMYSYHSVQV